ncbi:MAG: response regulator [Candidatus Krumholzibacteriia bacterium]
MQTILVCDDEANIRHIMDFSLEAEGFEVIEAADGDEALRLAVTAAPDLVLLDIMMPGNDGLTVCRHLKENPATRHIPVLLLTARAGKDDREAGLAAGANGYITKPFSPQRLVDKVNEMLGARS